MNTDILSLNHNRFSFRFVEGHVRETNMWSETHTHSRGKGKNQKIHTDVKNKLEFWLDTSDGKERHYAVDADKVKLRQGQDVIVVDYVKKNKPESAQAVLVLNKKQDTVYTETGHWSLMFDEKPILNGGLLLFIFFGWLGWFFEGFVVIHLLISLITGLWWFKKAGDYKRKLNKISAYLLEQT